MEVPRSKDPRTYPITWTWSYKIQEHANTSSLKKNQSIFYSICTVTTWVKRLIYVVSFELSTKKKKSVLVCVNKWLSGTNIIIRICQRNQLSFKGQAACLAHPSALGPGSSPVHYLPIFSSAPPRLRPSFSPTGGWWIDYVGGIGFCGFLLFPSSFHFVLIKFTMGSPMCLYILREGPFWLPTY